MKIHSKQGNQPNPHIVWHQKCEISIKIPLMTAKKCKISSSSSPNLEKNWNLGSGPNVVLALELFTYYVSNVYVPRVRANADEVLTTPPRVSRDPKKCWRNMWMAPNWYLLHPYDIIEQLNITIALSYQPIILYWDLTGSLSFTLLISNHFVKL